MKLTCWLINSLYALALAALSLGIPEECAFRYDLKSGAANQNPDSDIPDTKSIFLTLAGIINKTRTHLMATEAHLLGANRIHGPPLPGA